MSMNIEVVCDSCGTDITYTDNCTAYRIVVSSEPVRSKNSVVTLEHRVPPYSISRHFCGKTCLQKWASEGAK